MKKQFKLLKGNNMETLKQIPDNSIDSIVTDPPYGISFMSKRWDYDVPSVDFWKEVFRILKPGGHILSFGGTRTYHRMVVNIEDAGFEIRDQIMWIYGSGFPKSHNIGKAVDKKEGNKREVVGKDIAGSRGDRNILNGLKEGEYDLTKGNSAYEGYGTSLKPANEPICVARKPLSEKTVVDNVLKWGTGGINIDGCRIGSEMIKSPQHNTTTFEAVRTAGEYKNTYNGDININEGRFPANIIFECICDEVIKGENKGLKKRNKLNDHNENSIFGIGGIGVENYDYNDTADIHTNPNCPCFQLDEQSGVSKSAGSKKDLTKTNNNNTTNIITNIKSGDHFNDKGGASRYFYVAKVSKKERNLGLESFEDKCGNTLVNGGKISGNPDKPTEPKKNNHPTLKPIKLMSYLIRLVTPENGVILDPFMGSGSTGIAAMLEGKRFVGCELDEEYFKIAEKRIEEWQQYKKIIK
jgi:site-specific DNA-methyltransferase (adenine-specific)